MVGNAAYEGGNLGGAALGLEALGFDFGAPVHAGLVTLVTGIILWVGSYRFLERVFVVLVGLMSFSFLVTAVLTRPSWSSLYHGLTFQMPQAGLWTALALVGTTVVPYNLFLHSALVREKWAERGLRH